MSSFFRPYNFPLFPLAYKSFPKKIIYTVCFCFSYLLTLPIQAQNFTIGLPKEKIKNSLYNQIGLYDSRRDTLTFGMVQTSLYSTASYVIAEPRLYKQLQALADACNDSSTGKAELLFHLREFQFSEQSGATYEKGTCLLRGALYVRHARGVYQRLDVIDTLIAIKKTLDVTNALMKACSKTLQAFITENLVRKPSDTTIYNTADIKYTDSRGKSRTPLYSKDTLVDGLYSSYQSFAQQIPDKAVEVQMEYDLVRSAKAIDGNGELNKIGRSDAYAFVHKGNAYLITKTGYSLLKKKNNDYYFLEKWKKPPSDRHLNNSIINYGLTGGFAVSNETAYYEMIIDYLTGNLIRGKLIESF